MVFRNEAERELDYLCNGAISMLEMIGNYRPSQLQINMASKLLALICYDYMQDVLLAETNLQESQTIDVNQFIDSLVHKPSGYDK